MKLYTYPSAPSPQRVHIFMKEKGLEIPCEFIDLAVKAQLTEEYRAINSNCTVPALVLDDGTVIGEVVAICHYLEAAYPDQPLLGKSPKQKGLVVHWDHRIEMECLTAIAEALRNRGKGFNQRALPGAVDVEQIPALVERGIKRINEFFVVLDQQLADHQFIAGNFFSMADISAYVCVNFAKWVKVTVPNELVNLHRWIDEVAARPSVS